MAGQLRIPDRIVQRSVYVHVPNRPCFKATTCTEGQKPVSSLSSWSPINQFTFLVFRTHKGSQQTKTGKTTYTEHSMFRHSTVEHHCHQAFDPVSRSYWVTTSNIWGYYLWGHTPQLAYNSMYKIELYEFTEVNLLSIGSQLPPRIFI